VFTWLRALLAVILLVGFYVLVVGTVAGLVLLARLLGDPWGRYAALAALIVGGAALVALVRATRVRREDPNGLTVTPDQAPQLWDLVRDLADQVDTRAPDTILLVPEVNAAVSENARLLGLVGGRRTLLVGLPLLQAYSVDQLRAVLAHEMGHYSRSHTRLAAVTYRGKMTMTYIVSHVGPENLFGRLFTGYARLYFLVESAVSRRQEVEADRAAVRVAGRTATADALADLPVLDAAWDFYVDRYVGRGWRSGYAPDAIFGGFREFLAARGDELTKLQMVVPEPERSPWDSHPPIADRLASIASMPESKVDSDGRPATALLPNLAALTGQLEELYFSHEGQRLVPWDEYTVQIAQAELTARAGALLAEFARQAGRDSASATDLLDAIGTPSYDEFLRGVLPAATEAEPRRAYGPLAMVIAACAVRSGVAHWQHSWSAGPAILVMPDGERLDAEKIAERLADPQTTAQARKELLELGILLDLSVTQQAEAAPPARVIGAIANVVVNGKRRDLLIYNLGLLVLSGSDRTKMRNSLERLERLAIESTLDQLRSTPASQYMPYDQVTQCVRTRKTLLAQALTLVGGLGVITGGRAFAVAVTLQDGAVVRVRWGMETTFLGDSSEVLTSCVDQLAARTAPRVR
jgi:Zn-dependent protease with chaperone function